MFSKLLRSKSFLRLIIVPVLATGTLSSCGKLLSWVGETSPERISPKADLGFEPQCLSNVLPVMASFVSGEAAAKDIEGAWDCFAAGLDLFNRKVKGGTTDRYSSEELARFFEDYFFKDLKLSPALRTEVMRLKQVLVGGEIDSLTRQELLDLIRFSQVAKKASVEVLPYMRVISLNWKIDGRQTPWSQLEYFEAANLAFQKFLQTIGGQIQKNEKAYSLSSLLTLLEEIGKLYGKEWFLLEQTRRLLPVLTQVKQSLIGGEQDLIGPQEWTAFSLLIARGYIQYLRYYYFIEHYPEDLAEFDLVFLGRAFDDLFSYLADMVSFKPNARLSRADLLLLLQSAKKVFPQFKASDVLVEEVLHIKKALLGGSTEAIHVGELQKAREKVKSLQALGERFYAIEEIMLLRWTITSPLPRPQEQVLTLSLEEFERIASELGQLFESEYSLSRLYSLMSEILNIIDNGNANLGTLKRLQQSIPLIISGKALLTADHSTTIHKTQWPTFLTQLARGYGHYVFYHYHIKPLTTWRKNLEGSQKLFERVSTHLLSLTELHQGSITLPYFDRLLDSLFDSGFVEEGSFPLTLKGSKKLLRLLVQKWLYPVPATQRNFAPYGITKEHISYWEEKAREFFIVENWIASAWPKPEETWLDRNQVKASLSALGVKPLQEVFTNLLLESSYMLVSNDSWQLEFNHQYRGRIHGISIQNQNLFRLVLDLIVNAYQTKRSSLLNGVSEEEYNEFIADLWPILLDLDLVDPQKPTFGKSRFLEANLFMPSSNGNNRLEFAEAVQLAQFIFSGLSRNAPILKEVRQVCPSTLTSSTNKSYAVSCWLDISRRQLQATYVSMPHALSLYDKFSNKKFEKTWLSLLEGAGYDPRKMPWVPDRDSGLVPHLVQYIESLMFRFDRNRDQFLSREEAMAAYPVFRETLAKAANMSSDRILKGAYAYLLVYKKLPETTWERVKFITNWIFREDEWPIWVARNDMADVLRVIANIIRSEKKIQVIPEEQGNHSLPPFLQGE